MKKKIAIIAALCLALASLTGVLAACGEDDTAIPHYSEYFFYNDEELGGLVLTVPYVSAVASGELTLPEESWWYADGADGEETEHTDPLPVVAIADGSFAHNRNITSVVLPESLKVIGDRAFYRCSSLTGVTLSASAAEIGDEAFGYCSSLTSVSGGSIGSIGDYAFFSCSSLSSFTKMEEGATIGSRAFGYTGIDGAEEIGASGSGIAGDAFGDNAPPSADR